MTNLVEIDPQRAPFIVRLFERAATGQYSLLQLRRQLLDEGLHLCQKTKPSKSHIQRMLVNPFYTGWFLWNGVRYKGQHTPLISMDLYEKVQAVLGQRKKPKYNKHAFAFGGLLFCGKCGCMVTAEIKKSRYIYYHCTQSGNACDELFYREEELGPQFDKIVQGISIDPSIQDWLVKTLKESHKDETAYHQENLIRLQAELKKIKNRLDRLYLDKVDGTVSEAFWREKSQGWEIEQDRLIQQIQGHQSADRKYYEDGFKLLELAARSHDLYKKQPPDQKNKFLKIVLSNCTLQDGTLRPIYKKPFDILARGIETRKWGE